MKLDHDGYPTTCAICGKPVVKSRGGSVHELTVATGTAQSWHIPCRYPKEPTNERNDDHDDDRDHQRPAARARPGAGTRARR